MSQFGQQGDLSGITVVLPSRNEQGGFGESVAPAARAVARRVSTVDVVVVETNSSEEERRKAMISAATLVQSRLVARAFLELLTLRRSP